jgi:hypothetical protein
MCHVSKRCVYGIARKGMYVPCVKKDVCMVKPGKICICDVYKMCVWYSQERYVCAMCQKRCVYGIARKGMYVPCVKKDVCMV